MEPQEHSASPAAPVSSAAGGPIARIIRVFEKYFATAVVVVLVAVPAIETILRLMKIPGLEGIPEADKLIQHLLLVLTFVGGLITTRERRHLAIGALVKSVKQPWDRVFHFASALIASTVSVALSLSALSMVVNAFAPDDTIGFVPIHLFLVFLPIGYLFMGIRFITSAPLGLKGKLFAFSGILLGVFIGLPSLIEVILGKPAILAGDIPEFILSLHQFWHGVVSALTVPAIIVLVVSAFWGTPLFIVLGGVALMLFSADFSALPTGSLSVIPNAVYELLTGEYIPAIPLFAFVGFILAQSKAGERLMRLFRSLSGFIPGGVVIMVVIVSAFFTTFTGASGITILAMGGVLFYALSKQGNYSENFSVGLLTSSGSIGLLFPPSLPLILYGSIAQVSILDMFMGGIIPGVFMVAIMSATGIILSIRNHVPPVPFKPKEVLKSLKESIWEILIPFFILVPFLFGITKLVETSAFILLYTLIVEVVVHREIKWRDLPNVILKGVIIIGGVLVIIGTAQAFSEFIIDQQVPMLLASWMKQTIQSPILFLLILNAALLVTGCFMDIYAALIVVVPLIIPLGKVFGIDPVHLGIIFIINMEIGFLTPPVGLNLFLSSYCFGKPIGKIYRNTMPFFLIQIGVLFCVTYLPYIFKAVVGLFGGDAGG